MARDPNPGGTFFTNLSTDFQVLAASCAFNDVIALQGKTPEIRGDLNNIFNIYCSYGYKGITNKVASYTFKGNI